MWSVTLDQNNTDGPKTCLGLKDVSLIHNVFKKKMQPDPQFVTKKAANSQFLKKIFAFDEALTASHGKKHEMSLLKKNNNNSQSER